jgi:hypothetical protein
MNGCGGTAVNMQNQSLHKINAVSGAARIAHQPG